MLCPLVLPTQLRRATCTSYFMVEKQTCSGAAEIAASCLSNSSLDTIGRACYLALSCSILLALIVYLSCILLVLGLAARLVLNLCSIFSNF